MPIAPLADGRVKLCIDPSLNFSDGECRILVEGQSSTSWTHGTFDDRRQIASINDVDTLYGQGSALSIALKKIFKQCPDSLNVYAIGRPDPAGATAAVYTITIGGGPATSVGILDFYIFDDFYDVEVANGDTVTTIAANLAAAISPDCPFTATAAAGVVTFTAKAGFLGEVGNFFPFKYGYKERSGIHPIGVTVGLAQTTVATGSLPKLTRANYGQVLGTCCYTCYALLTPSLDAQKGARRLLDSWWSCTTAQCFGHGYTYRVGTSATLIAEGDNAEVFSYVAANSAGTFNTPGHPLLVVAAYAALSCCSACASPELSIQGPDYGVLDSIVIPERCATAWSDTGRDDLIDAGYVVYGALSSDSSMTTSPYIFNDVTNYLFDSNGKDNETFKAVSSRRLAAATAASIAIHLKTYAGLGFFTKSTSIKAGVFGTNQNLMLANIRKWAQDQVGDLFSEFDNISTDITLKTDFDVKAPCHGKPGIFYLNMIYQPPNRVDKFYVNLKPKLIDNCVR